MWTPCTSTPGWLAALMTREGTLFRSCTPLMPLVRERDILDMLHAFCLAVNPVMDRDFFYLNQVSMREDPDDQGVNRRAVFMTVGSVKDWDYEDLRDSENRLRFSFSLKPFLFSQTFSFTEAKSCPPATPSEKPKTPTSFTAPTSSKSTPRSSFPFLEYQRLLLLCLNRDRSQPPSSTSSRWTKPQFLSSLLSLHCMLLRTSSE